MHDNPQAMQHRPQRWLRIAGVAGFSLAALILAAGLVSRARASQNLRATTTAEAVPTVSVITPQGPDMDQALVLPGDFQAFYNAQIHARVSGYLKRWYCDIGAGEG